LSPLSARAIGFIGAGNMAEALIRGLVRGGHIPGDRVLASGPRRGRLDELSAAYGIRTTTDNREVARGAEILVLSVKPQILHKVLREISDQVRPDALAISIAAGVDTETIEEALGEGVRVVRAMPNVPATVGAGATAIATPSGSPSRSTRATSTRSPGCRAPGRRTSS
jgi:pyrroline-5-carboxylate reductase